VPLSRESLLERRLACLDDRGCEHRLEREDLLEALTRRGLLAVFRPFLFVKVEGLSSVSCKLCEADKQPAEYIGLQR
jgi:hypothetical protein